jgi:hypothetical protein
MKNWNRYIIPLQEKIQSLLSNKKNLLIIGGCMILLLLLLSLLVISIRMNHNQGEMQQASQESSQLFAPQAIKTEELFLPREPEFIPEVILDREPRDMWTEEDAEEFWNDPLKENTDLWKNRIIESVDDILENIP